MYGSSTPPSETVSGSMDSSSTSPQLPPSEAESGSMDGSSAPPQFTAPTFNILEIDMHADRYTSHLLMQRPPLGLMITPLRIRGGAADQPPENVGRRQFPASNIPVTSIAIGPWRRERRFTGDLRAKIYFGKQKLIWEFHDDVGGLLKKIEVSWSDITAINSPQPGILQIQLGNAPSFFRETPPQPLRRARTIWEETSDFTGGHASHHWEHYATFPNHGELDEHYQKLLQSDQRLFQLSNNPFPTQLPGVEQIPNMGESSRSANHQTPLPLPDDDDDDHHSPQLVDLGSNPTLQGSNSNIDGGVTAEQPPELDDDANINGKIE